MKRRGGFMLIECVVYIVILLVVLDLAYGAYYRCQLNSVNLRRNAEDIIITVRAGERWRADVRSATNRVRLEDTAPGQLLYLQGASREVVYRSDANGISRRLGTGPWVRVLPNVKSSTMKSDPRQYASPWCWELELAPRTQGSVKPGRVRPLFTFIAVPEGNLSK